VSSLCRDHCVEPRLSGLHDCATCRLPAAASATIRASDGHTEAALTNVAVGDVLLCGGQSNMGYGMCGALSATESPAEAMSMLAPVRFYFNHGSGPGGGSGPATPANHAAANCNGVHFSTPNSSWFVAAGNNTGGASAICMLTASALHKHLGGKIPVGAVESCQSATNVEPWTPAATGSSQPDGELYAAWIRPHVPFSFKAVSTTPSSEIGLLCVLVW
jgi:hypothetical protein